MKSVNCSFAVEVLAVVFGIVLCTSLTGPLIQRAHGGPYLDSAHGDAANGVDRSATNTLGYGRANCAHCHEQHASIEGSEPAPAGGAAPFALFYTNYVNQTDNVCVQCHVDAASVQSDGPIINRSYSYRAGAWTDDTVNDVLESFSFTSPASSHNLSDIVTFITGRWGYTANSNPCAACHNPHAAQGDPLAEPTSAKTSTTRGWPVSRPSEHTNTPWGLWGDDYTAPGPGNGERMNNYTLNYQAPYRFGSTTAYEPDGSATTDGSNLSDFSTFCTDCHNASNTIYSTNLGRNLRTIDWDNEKHGKGDADDSLCGDPPYPSGGTGLGKVLSCLDCHEPHGSANAFLIRREINGTALGGTIGSFSTTDWHYLCDRCHQDDLEISGSCLNDRYYISHHATSTGCATDQAYVPAGCGNCHPSGSGPNSCTAAWDKITCTDCHFHGSMEGANYTF